MSRKSQVIDFLRQQSRNRTEQAEQMRKAHAPNAQAIGDKRDQARMFEDAAKMCEAYEGPVTVTASVSDAEGVRAAREAEVRETAPPAPKTEAPKVRKKWTRKAIEESKLGPAIAANDRD